MYARSGCYCRAKPNSAVPVIDVHGVQLVGGIEKAGMPGLPVVRPNDGHDPVFFESQGDGANMVTSISQVSKFRVLERTDACWSEFMLKYRDYATIAIGLYGWLLTRQN